jgi:hypothetical protein
MKQTIKIDSKLLQPFREIAGILGISLAECVERAPFNQINRKDPFQVLSALTECFELYRQDLITFRQEEAIQRVEDMPLDSVSLHDSGTRLCLAMKLDTIPSEDVESVAALLK